MVATAGAVLTPTLGSNVEGVMMIKLKITGMTCDHCVMHVKQAILKVAGVREPVEISLEKGEAMLNGTPVVEEVLTAIKNEGYSASLG